MKAVLQRVKAARIESEGKILGEIESGLLVLLGVTHGDGVDEADFLAEKTVNLRIFEDESGKLNRSLLDSGGGILIVSNFTLYGDARHGRRPSFIGAASPDIANSLYKRYIAAVKDTGAAEVQVGCFGADMQVTLTNDGPVTLILDTMEIMSKNKKGIDY